MWRLEVYLVASSAGNKFQFLVPMSSNIRATVCPATDLACARLLVNCTVLYALLRGVNQMPQRPNPPNHASSRPSLPVPGCRVRRAEAYSQSTSQVYTRLNMLGQTVEITPITRAFTIA